MRTTQFLSRQKYPAPVLEAYLSAGRMDQRRDGLSIHINFHEIRVGLGGRGCRDAKKKHRSQGICIRGIAGWSPVPWIQLYQFCEPPRVERPPNPSQDRLGAAGRPEGLAFKCRERQILGRPGQWCWIGRSAPYCGVAFLDFKASLEAALFALRKSQNLLRM